MALWDKITSRGRVEDRRSQAPVVGGISLAGVLLYLVASLVTGGDPTDILSQLEQIPAVSEQEETGEFAGEDEYEVFASTVLGSNNDMWEEIFSQQGLTYSPPRLVLFRVATESACGLASSEVGPHYCPLDDTIYLDETFFDELTNRYGAEGGDVAEAYVISHEVAHHAQNELGIMDRVLSQRQSNPAMANDLSVKLELQSDCFAGLWVNHINDLDILTPGEIYEAMDAAEAVGDDRIQESTTGRINPEDWTHGSSEQRSAWFDRGYETGNFAACDTYSE